MNGTLDKRVVAIIGAYEPDCVKFSVCLDFECLNTTGVHPEVRTCARLYLSRGRLDAVLKLDAWVRKKYYFDNTYLKLY